MLRSVSAQSNVSRNKRIVRVITARPVGYMEPLFSDLYDNFTGLILEQLLILVSDISVSSTIKMRLSNSYLIGEIFGMLAFGLIIDKLGRRTGVVFATCFLIIGIIIATAAHGESQLEYVQSKGTGRCIMSRLTDPEQYVLEDDCTPQYHWIRRRRRISR